MATYEYGGKTYELRDGLSNEEALGKIKTSLGETMPMAPTASTPPVAAAPSMMDELGRQVGLTARAGITGITAVPAMMADFLTGAGGLATGKAIKPSSQALQEVLTQIGFPEPQGRLERAVQAGTGAMAGTGVQALAGQAIPALAPLAANPLQQVAASGAGGFAAQPAAEVATEITGSPLAGIAAGLATGTLAGATASNLTAKAGKIPTSPTTIADVKLKAQRSYQAVADEGIAIKPKSVLDMLNNAESELVKGNFNKKELLNGQSLS